ncbi:MAG: 4'-phosphopantetheinyl transferase superfamily protein [Lachnospiraceae bacterium]|nr:4'-phosphopantetheinyl transferase superfamily protein [Lachnospiraceae bacterium]
MTPDIFVLQTENTDTTKTLSLHEAGWRLVLLGLERHFPKSLEGREDLRRQILRGETDGQQILVNHYGKPAFADPALPHFNISHSGDRVVCALAMQPVGIDIQMKRRVNFDLVGQRLMPPAEYDSFLKMADKADHFFQAWVRMESYLKCKGIGISTDLTKLTPEGRFEYLLTGDKDYYCAVYADNEYKVRLEEVSWLHLQNR